MEMIVINLFNQKQTRTSLQFDKAHYAGWPNSNSHLDILKFYNGQFQKMENVLFHLRNSASLRVNLICERETVIVNEILKAVIIIYRMLHTEYMIYLNVIKTITY